MLKPWKQLLTLSSELKIAWTLQVVNADERNAVQNDA